MYFYWLYYLYTNNYIVKTIKMNEAQGFHVLKYSPARRVCYPSACYGFGYFYED